MAKRSRARKAAAAPAVAAAAAAPARPGARRLTVTLGVTFGLAAALALLAPHTGATLLGLALVLAAALGGARAGRALGVAPGVLAPLGGGAAFALLLAVGAARGPGLPPGLTLPGLAVTALGALLVVDVCAATAAARTPAGDRLGAALHRGVALRVAVTAVLGALAARGLWVAATTEHDPAWAVALLAGVAALRLWRAPGPAGTLLATLLCGLAPVALALGVGTDYGLWTPVTRPLAVICGGAEARPLLLAAAGLLGAGLAGALALSPPAAEPAPAA